MAPPAVCKSRRHLVGKVAIVTGANTGIGYETAKDFADRGARVILACRDDLKGSAARDKISQETENSNVVFKKLDLASLASVREFAKNILETEPHLDILVNNAGAYGLENKETEDGLNILMQINHFGPFLLTCLLVPLLKRTAASRVVLVSSLGHKLGRINFDDLNMKNYPNNIIAYSNTKLCNVLMAKELAVRLKDADVLVNSCHPGVVKTEIGRNIGKLNLEIVTSWFFTNKTPYEGAQTTIHLAVCRGVKTSGGYYDECKEVTPSSTAQNTEIARRLWEESAKLVNCSPDI